MNRASPCDSRMLFMSLVRIELEEDEKKSRWRKELQIMLGGSGGVRRQPSRRARIGKIVAHKLHALLEQTASAINTESYRLVPA